MLRILGRRARLLSDTELKPFFLVSHGYPDNLGQRYFMAIAIYTYLPEQEYTAAGTASQGLIAQLMWAAGWVPGRYRDRAPIGKRPVTI